MIVLGFDTATPATAVGLRLADGTTLRARDDPGAGQRPGHTTRLLPLASELLAQAGLRWSAVELIAVGLGPGTFTGLRIGVATARGLAQSLDVDVVGVSTPRVLAEAALQAQPADVLAVIDARRGEAFVAAFRAQGVPARHEPPLAPRAPALELAAPRALAPEDLGTVIGEARAERGKDRMDCAEALTERGEAQAERDWLAVGDGAIRFRGHLEALGVAVAPELSPLHRVDAGMLCELGLDAARGTLSGQSPQAVLPDYRRRPDAEIALEQAQS